MIRRNSAAQVRLVEDVKAHGGRASARSAGRGLGTTLEVRIPIAGVDTTAPSARDTIE